MSDKNVTSEANKNEPDKKPDIEKKESLVVQQTENLMPVPKSTSVVTADDARTVAVADLLTNAYSLASTLKLTESETKMLRAPFADDKVLSGAKGDARLLYISHIHISDRLNDVLGLGQWALVKRSQRAEPTKTAEGKPLIRIYFEGVMLIRGAFVAEAVGVGQYHPNNYKEDYGTGLESAMSDCLTRCCKRLGIGSQVWDKGFCDSWLAKQRKGHKPDEITSEQLQSRFKEVMKGIDAGDNSALDYLIHIGWLKKTEQITDLSAEHKKYIVENIASFKTAIGKWLDEIRANDADKNNELKKETVV